MMCDENKNTEEVKENNPVDEYLNNYKEQRLAEFCVNKDKEIECSKKELQNLMGQLVEAKRKADKYDKVFGDVKELYAEIKKLPVDEYLELYHMFSKDVSGYNKTSTVSITSSGLVSTDASWCR